MKKIFISALLLCSGIYTFAQLKVASIEKVDLPHGVTVNTATISPDGKFVVITQNEKNGIQRLDLLSRNISTISETGNGYGLTISADGNTIVFRESKTGEDRLRRTSLKSVNISTGQSSTIVNETRNLQGFAIKANTVMAVNNGKLSSKSLSSATKTISPVASIDKGRLMVTANGKTTNISPQGNDSQSYLWPSVSPDGTRVVYYLARTGCYVCNIDGTNPVYIGVVRAPRWYDNSTIVGMYDIDNGEYVTSSKIVTVNADGSAGQSLTEESSMAMYPTVSNNGEKIAYTTPSGELHIINIIK